MTFMSRFWQLLVLSVLAGQVVGCGGASPSTPVTSQPGGDAAIDEESSISLPTVAIPGLKPNPSKPKAGEPVGAKATDPQAAAKGPAKSGAATANKTTTGKGAVAAAAPAEPVKDSPEWLLLEIQRIRVMPLPGDMPAAEKPDSEEIDDEEKPLTAEEEAKLKEQFEKTRTVRKERNLQIIKLAELCIAKTARQSDQEAEFDAAVHYLLDSRLQLALQGDTASIDALFDAAKVFYERKADSAAAVEAQLTLVNLTHANALRFGQAEPKWIQEFAKHSQLYASRFPEEQARSVSLLSAAGRSCELAGMTEEARNCYSLLITKFPESPQGKQAAGVVRRLQLKGKSLELIGPTVDGGEFDIKSHRGKMVVVVFWASHAKPFTDQLPKLTATMKKYEKYATVVGVNLDADETALEAFLERSGLAWPQIFSPNRALRGWNSPLAVHYGVNNLPTIWLVDPIGIVADTSITADSLEPKLREVYLPFLKNAVNPVSGTK